MKSSTTYAPTESAGATVKLAISFVPCFIYSNVNLPVLCATLVHCGRDIPGPLEVENLVTHYLLVPDSSDPLFSLRKASNFSDCAFNGF